MWRGVCITLSAIAFGHWQNRDSAGWFMFFALCLLDEITVAIEGKK